LVGTGDAVHLGVGGTAGSTNFVGEASLASRYIYFSGALLHEIP
jgi:hypothetical protein